MWLKNNMRQFTFKKDFLFTTDNIIDRLDVLKVENQILRYNI